MTLSYIYDICFSSHDKPLYKIQYFTILNIFLFLVKKEKITFTHHRSTRIHQNTKELIRCVHAHVENGEDAHIFDARHGAQRHAREHEPGPPRQRPLPVGENGLNIKL